MPSSDSDSPQSEKQQLLDIVTNDLKHLNQTGFVRDIHLVPEQSKNNDIYTGVYSRLVIIDNKPQVSSMKVALKSMRQSARFDKGCIKSFVKETKIWSNVTHENIMPLEGFIVIDGYPCLVSEWEEHGTINQYIKNNASCDNVQLITGIACGVDHLHGKNIVHSDLKGDNILVGRSGQPKITDFGSSRMEYYTQTILRTSQECIKGTARWIAYELLVQATTSIKLQCTPATDMWAFGMVILEILTQSCPYANVHDMAVFNEIISKRLPKEPQLDGPVNKVLWGLCLKSWNHDPELRITAKEVLSFLRKLSENSTISSEALTLSTSTTSSPTAESVATDSLSSDFSAMNVGERLGNSKKDMQTTKRMIHLAGSKSLDVSSYDEYSTWATPGDTIRNNLKFPILGISGKIFLTSNRFPIHLKSKWSTQVDVHENIANYHILHQIYTSLFTKVDGIELKSIRKEVREDAEARCSRRCNVRPSMSGLRRVDFLGKYRWLKGIRLENEELQIYYIVTRESRTNEEKTSD